MNFVLKPWKVGGEVLELLETVYHLANSAKVNSKNCKKAAGRIKAWEHIVKNCMKEYQKTDDVETHVECLSNLMKYLEELRDLIEDYSNKNFLKKRFDDALSANNAPFSFKNKFENVQILWQPLKF